MRSEQSSEGGRMIQDVKGLPDAKDLIDRLGKFLIGVFVLVALFVIGATIVWAAAQAYAQMIRADTARLDDILLLFIYLELGSMVGIYFKTDRLPVSFLLYVAITAMTRFLVVDFKELEVGSIVLVTVSIVLLTFAVLVLHVAASRFSLKQTDSSIADLEGGSDVPEASRRARCVEALW